MLFYFSIADDNTGAFIGGVYLNGEDMDATSKVAANLAMSEEHPSVEVAGAIVPASDEPIPPINKLMNRAELEKFYTADKLVIVRIEDGVVAEVCEYRRDK